MARSLWSSALKRTAGVLRIALWAAAIASATYLMLAYGGGVGIYLAQLRILDVAIAGAAVIIWTVAAVRNARWWPRSNIWPAFAASLAVFAVCEVTSRQPRLGADYLAYAFILTALYLLLQRLFVDQFWASRVASLAVLFCIAIGVLYVTFTVQAWIAYWNAIGRIGPPPLRPDFQGLYGNPSPVAAVDILLFLGAAAHLGTATRSRRLAVAGLGLLTGVTVLLTGSRGAWVALAAASAVGVFIWLSGSAERARARAMLLSRRFMIVIAGLVLAGMAALVPFAPALASRMAEPGTDYRLSFYAAALRMFISSPLVGTGPGTWTALRGQFTYPSEVDFYIPHAHNIYLQTLSEFGLLGAVAGLVVFGCLAWLVLGAFRARDPVRRRFGWAVLIGLVYLGVHQLVDVYANMPAMMFALALSVAHLDALSPESVPQSGLLSRILSTIRTSRWALRAAVAVMTATLIGSFGWLGWSESQALTAAQASAEGNAGHWTEALATIEDAVRADPAMPPYQFLLGLAAAHTGNMQAARTAFATSAASDDFPEAWLNLADTQLQLGDAAGARVSLVKAMRLGFQQAEVSLPAGVLYLRLGDSADAEAAFADALTVAPGVADDPYWATSPALQEAWVGAVDRAMTSAPADAAFQIALLAGRSAAARQAANRLDPSLRSIAGTVIGAWNGDRSAFNALAAAARSDPLDYAIAGWCPRIAFHLTNDPRTGSGQKWTCAGSLHPAQYEVIRVTSLDVPMTALPGANAAYYGLFTYRRPTPDELVVPQLPHLKATVP